MQNLVTVNRDYRITLPREARTRLGIRAGDRFMVDVQDGMIVLVPEPANFVDALAGRHREVWANVDTDAYLRQERGSWDDAESASGV